MPAPANTAPKVTLAAPVFAVADAARAAQYYTASLHFQNRFQWADEEGAPPRYVILQTGGCELHLSQTQKPRASAAYFFLRELRAYHAAAKSAGARITHPPRDMPWQMREFEVTDLDGNQLIFGEPLHAEGE